MDGNRDREGRTKGEDSGSKDASRDNVESPKLYSTVVSKRTPQVFRNALENVKEEQRDAHANFFKLMKKPARPPKDVPAQFKAEKEFKVRLVHIHGFPFLKIGELKAHMHAMHFMLTKIKNFRYIGKSVLELLVEEDYVQTLKNKIGKWEGAAMIAEDFDPRQHHKEAPSQQEKKLAKNTFIRKCVNQIRKSDSDLVKSFYLAFLEESGDDYLSLAHEVDEAYTNRDRMEVDSKVGQNGRQATASPTVGEVLAEEHSSNA
jgi:hypothetical protein